MQSAQVGSIGLRQSRSAESKKQARQQLAQDLCGMWEGQSVRASNGSVTVWSSCELYFNVENGRITGKGTSVWRDELVQFLIRGCFDRQMQRVELIKTHMGKYTTSTHYSLGLDGTNLRMTGTYQHGTLELRKNQNRFPAPSADVFAGVSLGSDLRSKAGGDETAHDGASGSGSLPSLASMPLASLSSPSTAPLPATTATSARVGVSGAAGKASASDIKPAEKFLKTLFGPKEGDKYFQMLLKHQVDWDSLRLMKEEHLKELGFPMGPRVKIVNSLKLLNGGAAAASASGSAAGAGSVGEAPAATATGAVQKPAETVTATPSSPPGIKALVPQSFACAITREIMREPVLCADGHTYERVAIEKWLESHNTSPITNKILRTKTLQPNFALRSVIQEWLEKNGYPAT